jgi:rfaE bifunctional protein nucleotidyltransferase chain/domain
MLKIKSLPHLKKEIEHLRKKNKTIVFTNGCFDILHPGHIKILKEAKQKGDILIVGLNRDKSIKTIKGKKRPIMDEKSRAQVLSAVSYVDYIVFFQDETPLKLITQLKPDVLVKGGDWKKDEIVGAKLAKKVHRVKLKIGHSTTYIIEKIKKHA